MKDKLHNLFIGRQGMDELSKFLFWSGLAEIFLAALLGSVLNGVFSGIFLWLGLFSLIMSFVRAFSKKLGQREAENNGFLALRAKKSRDMAARRERFRQRKDFCFFKCPGCGAMIRVPRGKGRIHITCRCGYQLYRKT